MAKPLQNPVSDEEMAETIPGPPASELTWTGTVYFNCNSEIAEAANTNLSPPRPLSQEDTVFFDAPNSIGSDGNEITNTKMVISNPVASTAIQIFGTSTPNISEQSDFGMPHPEDNSSTPRAGSSHSEMDSENLWVEDKGTTGIMTTSPFRFDSRKESESKRSFRDISEVGF
jgi:hypothetical protein